MYRLCSAVVWYAANNMPRLEKRHRHLTPHIAAAPAAENHSTDGVGTKQCNYPGCTKNSSLGIPGSNPGQFCTPQTTEDGVEQSRVSLHCSVGAARRLQQAAERYGVVGSVVAEYCSTNAKPDTRAVARCSWCATGGVATKTVPTATSIRNQSR